MQGERPTKFSRLIREYFNQCEFCCGCNRLLTLLASNIYKKFKKRCNTSELSDKFGSKATLFNSSHQDQQEDMGNSYKLTAFSTSGDEIADEVKESNVPKCTENLSRRYHGEAADISISKEIDNEKLGRFMSVNLTSTNNLFTNNQMQGDELIFPERIRNEVMERTAPVKFESDENLAIDYQCKATRLSNFEEITNSGRQDQQEDMENTYELEVVSTRVDEIADEFKEGNGDNILKCTEILSRCYLSETAWPVNLRHQGHQEDMENTYELEVVSTRVDEIADEFKEGNDDNVPKFTENLLRRYHSESADLNTSTNNLCTNYQMRDELVFPERIPNEEMERAAPVSVENFSMDYQCRATGLSNFEEISDEDIRWITPIKFKSPHKLFINYKSNEDIVEDINNEIIEPITPPVKFQSMNNLLTNHSGAGEPFFPEEIGRISPVNLKSFEDLLINYQSGMYKLNDDKWTFTRDLVNNKSLTERQESSDVIIQNGTEQNMLNTSMTTDVKCSLKNAEDNEHFPTEKQKSPYKFINSPDAPIQNGTGLNTSLKKDVKYSSMNTEDDEDFLMGKQNLPYKSRIGKTKHIHEPRVVGIKYSPVIYDVLNTSLNEKQNSHYTLEPNTKDNTLIVGSGDKNCQNVDLNFTPQKLAFDKASPKKELKANTEVCVPARTATPTRRPYKSIDKDSQIIRQLVMERFNKTLREFNERKSKRQLSRQGSSSSSYEEKLDTETKTGEVHLQPNVNVYYNQADEMTSSSDSGLEDMAAERLKGNSSDISGSSEEAKETVEYDSQEFLRQALGDEYLNQTYESQDKFDVHSPLSRSRHRSMYSTERSIGSSEISTLVSNVGGSKSEGIYSLYSTIRNPARRRAFMNRKPKAVQPLFNTVSTHYYDYANIDFRINPHTQELIKEDFQLQSIIDQVSKALLFCRNKPKFFGDIPHIEAEKLLLLSSFKKGLLVNEINKAEYEELEERQRVGTVKILNLKCSTKPQTTPKKKDIRYYICLVHSGLTVLASEITTPEPNGEVIFLPNCFEYKELLSDFEIRISIYGMIMDKNENKKNMNYNSPRNTLRKSKKSIDKDPAYSLTPLFELLGNCKIGLSDLNRNIFKLENMPCNATINDELVADIKSSIEIKNKISGFLNIGTSCSLWNRRWCILDSFHLKYWNYPAAENDMEPIGVFDLSFCTTYPVNRVDRSVCSRARTFVLEIVEGTDKKTYFFAADTLVEFEEWKRQLNLHLITLRNWDQLKC